MSNKYEELDGTLDETLEIVKDYDKLLLELIEIAKGIKSCIQSCKKEIQILKDSDLNEAYDARE